VKLKNDLNKAAGGCTGMILSEHHKSSDVLKLIYFPL